MKRIGEGQPTMGTPASAERLLEAEQDLSEADRMFAAACTGEMAIGSNIMRPRC